MCDCAQQILWIKSLFRECHLTLNHFAMFGDNKGACHDHDLLQPSSTHSRVLSTIPEPTHSIPKPHTHSQLRTPDPDHARSLPTCYDQFSSPVGTENRDGLKVEEILTAAHREFSGCAHRCAGKPKRRDQDRASPRRRGHARSGTAEG